jgi:hypothetical protein
LPEVVGEGEEGSKEAEVGEEEVKEESSEEGYGRPRAEKA